MGRRIAAAALASLMGLASARAGIETTAHNLSVGGPGPVRATRESGICVFCHIPHRASTRAPLWNRRASTAAYQPYGSSTLKAAPGQPTGASILCLSCHDGTIAFGAVLSRTVPFPMAGGVSTMPAARGGLLGTDLRDDHPVSFAYAAAVTAGGADLLSPELLTGAVRLDGAGQLQCTSCHDPHDDTYPPFLVTANGDSALCRQCHRPTGWELSAHGTSGASLAAASEPRWPHAAATTVRGAACLGCHKAHTAQGAARLLLRAREEDNCLICHDGTVATKNVKADFQKGSRHRVDGFLGSHDPAEAAVVPTRHVECTDCHNPHAARGGDGVDGPLAGVRGASASGNPVPTATAEVQVCFRCHAASPGQPAPRVNRHLPEPNLGLRFGLGNASFHPVLGPTGRTIPSIEAAWRGKVLACSDCHGSDQGPAAGGAGPRGVHGSIYPSLLARAYQTAAGTAEGAGAYALCYGCHRRDSILANDSFPRHRRYVVERQVPCSVCHTPHGVTSGAWLVNFDLGVVAANDQGELRFASTGAREGWCSLRCHGVEHRQTPYPL